MTFNQVGTVEVGPQDREVLVGSFSLGADDDCIWFRIQQINPPEYFKFAYGLLTWRTEFGKELGTIKVYGDPASEVYRLSNGNDPISRTGSVLFTPRAFNRGWISVENPPTWTLNFEAKSGVLNPDNSPPVFGTRASLGVLADLGYVGITYTIGENGFASVKASPK